MIDSLSSPDIRCGCSHMGLSARLVADWAGICKTVLGAST
jgi:hypothetical protein